MARATTISNISCRTRSGSRRSGIAAASRRHTPSRRSASRQQAGVGGLVTAFEIHCEFLAVDGWQIEGKWRISVHDGCGAAAVRLDNDM
jgi:hypothetical protein